MYLTRISIAALSCSLLAAPAFADEPSASLFRGELSFHASYLIAGGSSRRGGTAPSTGGVALIPTLRGLLALPWVDPYVAISPIIVTPYSLKATGFVCAVDGGVSWHPRSRAWALGTGATVAPTYMRLCNESWCLKEWLLLYGGEVHLGGRFLQREDGGGLSGELSVRVLTGKPTAWFWPNLTPEEAAIFHYSWTIGGGLLWRF